MKRLFLLISLVLSLSSCSVTHYMQLVTLHSDNVSDVDDSYIYIDDIYGYYVFNGRTDQSLVNSRLPLFVL